MNRWDELPEDFYQVDKSEMNSHRIGFLKSLGIDTNNIPNCMYEKFIWLNEMNISISKMDGKYEVVYIKDVIGTTHKDYGDIPLIQSFKRLKRAADRCKYLKAQTPLVYHRQLHKHPTEQWTPKLPIGFIKVGTKYFIYGNGNHRTIIYKIMYLAELINAKDNSEIKKIENKYFIWSKVYNL
jgi:hypothetical protein